jgi:hypothetical protein
MFILYGAGRYNEAQYIIGYSQDKLELQAMITEFNESTRSTDGSIISFDSCPDEIKFGSLLLKKDPEGVRCYFAHNSSGEKIIIYDYDRLFLAEVNHVSNPKMTFVF